MRMMYPPVNGYELSDILEEDFFPEKIVDWKLPDEAEAQNYDFWPQCLRWQILELSGANDIN